MQTFLFYSIGKVNFCIIIYLIELLILLIETENLI